MEHVQTLRSVQKVWDLREFSPRQLTETTTLEVVPDVPLGLGRVFRRLEVVRQRLAVRWCGTPGAFAGYDALEVAFDGEIYWGSVTFTARIVSADETTHTVQLEAKKLSGHESASKDLVILQGQGRSLNLRAT